MLKNCTAAKSKWVHARAVGCFAKCLEFRLQAARVNAGLQTECPTTHACKGFFRVMGLFNY